MLYEDSLGADFQPALDALLGSIEDTQAQAIRTALSQVVARLIEGRLLTDTVLTEVARYPDIYLARAEQLVMERIRFHGLDAVLNEFDARHIARLLTAGVPKKPVAEPVREELVQALFRRLHAEGGRELRCALCGYHFRQSDLSPARNDLAGQFGFVFAGGLHAKRKRDSLKPSYETEFHIDHIVPRIGWGPTRLDNLQPLCKFCNLGKWTYRRGLEGVSTSAAFCVPPLNHLPSGFAIRHSMVAAFMAADSHCALCGEDARQRELTATQTQTWFVPWTLSVQCYECA